MCYLRNFTPIYQSFHTKQQESVVQTQDIQNIPNALNQQFGNFEFNKNLKSTHVGSKQSQILLNILKLAQMNTKALENLTIKIDKNNSLIDEVQLQEKCNKILKSVQQNQFDSDQSTVQQEKSFKTQQFLTQKLFGNNREYKYQLLLDGDFPQQIFKQRNFSFNVKLSDKDGNLIRNSNIIHLCLGISDVNGQWITETKTNLPLVKGNTQSQLYHGQSSYSKIFSRDVSRNYPEGILNIVVYPKQSVLKYFNRGNCLQKIVDSADIEPLVIRDLIVKAKKKQ